MAININPGKPLRHVATFNSTGNFVFPAGTNAAFISTHGASGGGGAGGYNNGDGGSPGGNGGPGLVSGAWVQVTPGATHAITIGAGGTGGVGANATGTTGGTGGTGGSTIFDQAITVVGGAGGNGGSGNTYTNAPGTVGSTGTSSGQTTLTSLAPSNSSIIRTGTISNQNTGQRGGGSRGNAGSARYGQTAAAVAGSAGSAGIVHIYI